MTRHTPVRPRFRLTIGLAGAVLAGLTVHSAAAKPEGADRQVAQSEGPVDPAPAQARTRPRKPAPTPAVQAVSKAETPPAAKPSAPVVVPPAQAAEADPPTQAPPATVTEPIRHAREARLGRCLETVTKASSSTVDTAHAAVSTWSQKGPDDHMFQSIVALSYSNAVAPKAAAVLVAAPEGTGCEATTVQVYPTTRSCRDVEGDLKKAGRTVGDFGGVGMTQEQGASRHLLLPAPGTGCVVVAVGLALNP